MKYSAFFLSLCLLFIFIEPGLFAQKKIYSVSSGELIFSLSQAQFNDDFLTSYPEADLVKTNMRFTLFFHFGQYWHFDLSNNYGLITGIGVRNVGLISDEQLPDNRVLQGEVYMGDAYTDYKIIRRSYLLGVPLMVKLGSFKDHLFVFGGAEYEYAFHFKEKYWVDTHRREGSKHKNSEWFSNRTAAFLPSLIGGVQFTGGINLKFKYYLTDFLNHNYTKVRGDSYSVSDQSRYETSQVFYFSLTWQFNTEELSKKTWQSTAVVAQK